MNRTRNVKLNKITVTVVALVAVALILGLLFTALPVRGKVAQASTVVMSHPGTVFAINSSRVNDAYSGTTTSYYGWNSLRSDGSTYDTLTEHGIQSSIDSLSYSESNATSIENGNFYFTRNSNANFTKVADNTTSYFVTSPFGWQHNIGTSSNETMDNVIFIHTFQLDDTLYQKLATGEYYVKLEASACLGGTEANSDTDTWLYVGLGEAVSGADVKSYLGFNELASVLSARYDGAGYESAASYSSTAISTSLETNNPVKSGLKTGVKQTLIHTVTSGTKYLRVGMYGEVWGETGTIKLDTVSLRTYICKNPNYVSPTATDKSNMTRPTSGTTTSTWEITSATWPVTQTMYDNTADADGTDVFFEQSSEYTFGTSGSTLTATTSDSTNSGKNYFKLGTGDLANGIYQTGWGSTSSSANTFLQYTNLDNCRATYLSEHSGNYDYSNNATGIKLRSVNGSASLGGSFYTVALTDNLYNALINGKVSCSLGANSNILLSYAGCFRLYCYIGIGYAKEDTYASAKTGIGFVETYGYVGKAAEYDRSGTSTGVSFTSNTTDYNNYSYANITNLKFTDSGVNVNENYAGNNYTKYLRFGFWFGYRSYTASGTSSGSIYNLMADLTLTPVTDSNATSFGTTSSGTFTGDATNGYYSSDDIVITDATGIKQYEIDGVTHTLGSNYTSVNDIQSQTISNLINGKTYVIKVTDIWGNSSSTVNITYYKPILKLLGATNGTEQDYSGGKVSGYQNQSWYNSGYDTWEGANNTTFNLWAQPNAGYYFAGFTIDGATFSANVNNLLQSGSSPTGGGYAYTSCTSDLKFCISVNASASTVTLPSDGVILVIAHFKAIETEGAGTYTYDKTARPVNSSPSAAVDGFGGSSGVVAEVSYVKDGASVTTPIDAGTYTASMVIKANNIAVSSAVTETVIINKKDITATFAPENTSKVYDGSTDASNNGIVGTLHDYVTSDVVAVSATYAYNSKDVENANVINVTDLTLTGAQSGNYNLTTTSATVPATITAKPIAVELEAVSKVYDGTLSVDVNLVGSIDLGVSGEAISATAFSGTLADQNVGIEKPVTLNATLTPENGTSLSNYAFSYPTLKTNVTLRSVTLTADNYTHTYNKLEPSNDVLTYQVTNGTVIGNDDLNVTLTKASGVDVKEGGYVITLDASNTNYDITKVNGVCTVAPRSATVTADNVTHVYDKAEPLASELTYTLTDVIDGDYISVTLSKATGVTVGEYAVTITEATNSNYTLTTVDGVCTISKRLLTVAVDDAQGHVYDGTELCNSVLSYSVTSTNKVMSGDDLGISVEKAVGVNVNTYALTFNLDNLNSNYSVDVTTGVYTISARPITISADDMGHVYDGTELGENILTYTLVSNNLVGNDDLGLTVTKEEGINVGTYDIIINVTNLNDNYSVSNNSSGVYTISKRPIKLQANQASVPYTGLEPTSLDYTILEGELVVGDVIDVIIAKELGVNVGRYLFSYVFEAEAEANKNYNISTVSGLYYTINQAVLTVSYTENITFGTVPSGALTYEGFQNGETLEVLGSSVPSVDFESIANANKTYVGANVYINVGSYKLTATGGTNANYKFNCVEGTLTVAQKAVTLTYVETITYGGTPSSNANSTAFSYEGIVEGDTPTFTYTVGTLPTSASATPYAVDESYFTVTSLNYAVSISDTSTLTINKATVTVKANLVDTAFVYGDLAFMNGITYVYSGIKAIDDAESIKAQINPQVDFTSLLNENGYVDYSSTDYSVSPTSTTTLENYNLTFESTQFRVTKRPLTLSYTNDDATKIYDGQKPDLSGASVEISGFADGEAVELTYTLSNLTSANVGNYDVYVNVADSELQKIPNYTIATINNGKYAITEREITVTVVDQIFTYGDEITVNSVFGTNYTVENIVSGESLDVEITTDKQAGTPVGSYELQANIKGANKNYIVKEVVGGHLIVNEKEVTLTLNNQTVVYANSYVLDQTDYQAVEGLFGVDDLGVTVSFVDATPVNVGTYDLTATITNVNYILTNTPTATFTVVQKDLQATVAFKNASIKLSTLKANLSAEHFTVSYFGFIEGEDESVLTTPITVDVERIKLEAVAQEDFPIYYNGGEAQNYVFTNINVGVINILADKLVIDTSSLKFEDKEVPYNGENQNIEIEWQIPEGISVSYSYTQAGVIVTEHKNVAEYVVTAHFDVPEEYESISDRIAHLVIIKKEATVTLQPQTSVYGEEISLDQTKYTAEGFIAGDAENVTIGFEAVTPTNVGVYNLTANTSNGNYTLVVEGGANAYKVTPRAITLTASNLSAVYGETAAVPEDGYTVNGNVVGNDDLHVTITLENAEKYLVGTEYALVISAENENYSFTLVNGKLSVTPKNINLILNNLSVVYGESIDLSKVEYSFEEGASEYDDVLIPALTVTQAEKYVVGGTYLITATLDNANYLLNSEDSYLEISLRPVTITLETQSSVYGALVVIDDTKYTVTSEMGVIDGDDLNVDIFIPQGGNSVGNYTLTATYSNENYHVTIVDGVYSIVKAETVIYTDNYQTEYVYTGQEISLKATAESYAYSNRENPTLYIKYEVVGDEGNLPVVQEVGEYVVRIFMEESNNFLAKSEYVTVYVVKATPVIDFSNLLATTFTYNGAEQHVTISKDDISNKELKDGQISYLNNMFKEVPENGELEVTVTLQETKSYTALEETVTIKINKANYDMSNVQFLSYEVDYDGTEHSLAVTGLHESITVNYVYGEITQAEPFTFKNAGVYNVQANYTYDERNYNAPEFLTEASLTIERLNITVKVVEQSGFYGDEPHVDSENIEILAGTFVEGDEIAISVSLESRESYPVGTYSLVATSGESGNYNVTVASGSYTILPRPTEIRIENKTAQYGDAQVPYTYVATNAVEGDTFNANIVRVAGKDIGDYVISGTFVNPNYNVTSVTNGVYTIVPRNITIVVANQEGTSQNDISKKGYHVTGNIVRGDDLGIRVEGTIGTEPGEYPLTATYKENANYNVTVTEGIFTLRLVSVIKVRNYRSEKLYDGMPYVFDVSVSSGAIPQFSIEGLEVENSFTEVGVYEITISAPVKDNYAAPESYIFTFEIRPTVLSAEIDGIMFKVEKADGFRAVEHLVAERNEDTTLSGQDYTSKITAAYTLYIQNGEDKTLIQEYFGQEEISVKIKLSEELQNVGVSTWFRDHEINVLEQVEEPDDDGYVSVSLAGVNNVVFVTDRTEATPILVVGVGMGFAFIVLMFFFIFRKKAL